MFLLFSGATATATAAGTIGRRRREIRLTNDIRIVTNSDRITFLPPERVAPEVQPEPRRKRAKRGQRTIAPKPETVEAPLAAIRPLIALLEAREIDHLEPTAEQSNAAEWLARQAIASAEVRRELALALLRHQAEIAIAGEIVARHLLAEKLRARMVAEAERQARMRWMAMLHQERESAFRDLLDWHDAMKPELDFWASLFRKR